MPPKKPLDPNQPAKPRAARRPAAATLPFSDSPPLEMKTQPQAPAAKTAPLTGATPVATTPVTSVDIEIFARNFARIIEEGGKALAAYMKPREEGKIAGERAEEVTDVVKTLGQVVEYWFADPQRTFELQSNLGKSYLDLWMSTAKRMTGETTPAVAQPRRQEFRSPRREIPMRHG